MPDEPQIGIEDIAVAQLIDCAPDPDVLVVAVTEVVPCEDAKA